ncbi:MAG: TlpA family protein disulfide reductase [Bacteroidia bacterium]|nr:TlpA family protein disulfide reductase [Bacteroidia bacterium]
MMKYLYLLSAVILVLFSDCKEKKNSFSAIVCGHLENPKSQNACLSGRQVILQNTSNADTVLLDSQNNFKVKIRINEPGYYNFRHEYQFVNIYLKPGDSISLSLTSEKFKGNLKFSGNGAEENNCLAGMVLFNEKIGACYEKLFRADEKRFIVMSDSLRSLQQNYLENLIKTHKVTDENFSNSEKAKLLYSSASLRLQYKCSYNTQPDNSEKLSDNFDTYLTALHLNDSNLLNLPEYTIFLAEYLRSTVEKESGMQDDLNIFKAKIQNITKVFRDKKVQEYLFYASFKEQMRECGIRGIEPMMKDFYTHCNDKKYTEEIKQTYDGYKKLEKGNTAPDFNLPDLTGKIYSLKDFKGKYIYMDVWATWCAPCRREIPFMDKLQKEFKNKNIVFISISIDKKKEDWENFVKTEKPQWLQLHSDSKVSTLTKDYRINFIPHFILIDKEGKIIDAWAPAPSQNIKEVLNKLEGGVKST